MAAKNAKEKKGTQTTRLTAGIAQSSVGGQSAGGAEALLKADHRKIEGIFQQFKNATSPQEKQKLALRACKELIIHSQLEEEIFYPACREKNVDDDLLDEAQVEHDSVKAFVGEIIEGSPEEEFFDAKVNVLAEYVKHHVGEEEKARTGIFAKAKRAGVDMSELGTEIQSRKQELMGRIDENHLELPGFRALHPQDLTTHEDFGIARERGYQGHDEEGRFTSRGYGSRSRYADDDEERGRYSRGRSQGGWFGDSEGHREAAERGSEERGGGRYSRSRYEDEDKDRGRASHGRREGGWFGDDREGHREGVERDWEERGRYSRSRYEHDDDDRGRSSRDRGHGGWFGDPEGHSEASERGWEHRRGGYSSRSGRDEEDEDDGRHRTRDRGHGGWFGDSEGHAEAARRRRD